MPYSLFLCLFLGALPLFARKLQLPPGIAAGAADPRHTLPAIVQYHSEALAACRAQAGGPSSAGLASGAPDSIRVHYDRALTAACTDPQLIAVACDQALLQKELPFRKAWAERHNRVLRTDVGWRDICARLAPGEAAIEFVCFRSQEGPGAEQAEQYAAFVLLPDGAPPRFAHLCTAAELDAVLKQETASELRYQQLYAALSEASPLYALVWQPLEAHLSGVQTVYYAPAGLLHRINPGAIHPAKRKCLADRYHLRQLSSLHVLLDETPAHNARLSAAVFAAPQFTLDSIESAGGWNNLPGAQKEGAEVLRLLSKNNFKVTFREGADATEAAIRRTFNGKSPSPRVLHLATHGFWMDGRRETVDGGRWTVDGRREAGDGGREAGVLLAGANVAWKAGRHFAENEADGILTATELGRLDLRHTELAVLSAGESAIVDTDSAGEAYGLPRACKLAGARYVIGTLWTMPDRVFPEMMQLFYEQWLDEGRSIPDAFREAQAQLRARNANPYYWAGFILIE